MGLPALRLDATSLDCLLEYDWPGNVRELENAVEHAAVFCQDSVILPKHFPARILAKREPRESRKEVDLSRWSLADIERDHIQRVLSAVDGSRTEAAKILGIGEATLYRRLRDAQHEDVS
jgi:DNA-binding NtrC family response regulator